MFENAAASARCLQGVGGLSDITEGMADKIGFSFSDLLLSGLPAEGGSPIFRGGLPTLTDQENPL